MCQGSWPLQSEERVPASTNACRQMHAEPARALNFGEFNGSELKKFKLKKRKNISGSIFLCMKATIPGTHGSFYEQTTFGEIETWPRLGSR